MEKNEQYDPDDPYADGFRICGVDDNFQLMSKNEQNLVQKITSLGLEVPCWVFNLNRPEYKAFRVMHGNIRVGLIHFNNKIEEIWAESESMHSEELRANILEFNKKIKQLFNFKKKIQIVTDEIKEDAINTD